MRRSCLALVALLLAGCSAPDSEVVTVIETRTETVTVTVSPPAPVVDVGLRYLRTLLNVTVVFEQAGIVYLEGFFEAQADGDGERATTMLDRFEAEARDYRSRLIDGYAHAPTNETQTVHWLMLERVEAWLEMVSSGRECMVSHRTHPSCEAVSEAGDRADLLERDITARLARWGLDLEWQT